MRSVFKGWRRKIVLNIPSAKSMESFGPFTWIVTREAAFRLKRANAPYWSVVTPLTVLSAWLLISKPRQLKPESDQKIPE